MSETQWISLLLLIGRVITVVFIIMVLRLQWKLIRQNMGPELQWYRKSLFALSAVSIAANFIPITIDVFGLLGKGSYALLLAYVFSNNISAMVQAFTLWLIYHVAGNQAKRSS